MAPKTGGRCHVHQHTQSRMHPCSLVFAHFFFFFLQHTPYLSTHRHINTLRTHTGSHIPYNRARQYTAPICQENAITGTESENETEIGLTEKHRQSKEEKDREGGMKTESAEEGGKKRRGAPQATWHPHPED